MTYLLEYITLKEKDKDKYAEDNEIIAIRLNLHCSGNLRLAKKQKIHINVLTNPHFFPNLKDMLDSNKDKIMFVKD